MTEDLSKASEAAAQHSCNCRCWLVRVANTHLHVYSGSLHRDKNCTIHFSFRTRCDILTSSSRAVFRHKFTGSRLILASRTSLYTDMQTSNCLLSNSEAYVIKLGPSQVLHILPHSGSDPKLCEGLPLVTATRQCQRAAEVGSALVILPMSM